MTGHFYSSDAHESLLKCTGSVMYKVTCGALQSYWFYLLPFLCLNHPHRAKSTRNSSRCKTCIAASSPTCYTMMNFKHISSDRSRAHQTDMPTYSTTCSTSIPNFVDLPLAAEQGQHQRRNYDFHAESNSTGFAWTSNLILVRRMNIL